jgi:REP element-mobilizing transposase RayT
VLRRPWRVQPLIDSIETATPEPHRTLFIVNDDDEHELDALKEAGAEFLTVDGSRRSYACKINAGYHATSEPLVFMAADDLHFRPDWCRRAQALLTETVHVVGTNDICNPRVMTGAHSTHTLLRRSYIKERSGVVDQPDTVLHEGYPHEFCDDEFIQTAMTRGVYAHAFDSIVEHLHPMVGKAEDDDTYRLGRQRTRESRRLFQQRTTLWKNGGLRSRRASVVTASYGGVDAVLHRQAAQDITVDWICFTDNPNLTVPPPWRKVVEPAQHEHPCLAAKVHKMTPHVETTDVVWIDASHEITSKSFVREALEARRDGVAAFKHPRRDCIYDEADASLGSEGQGGKYDSQPLLEQVAHYRTEGHPEHGGLWACGVVAWDLANPNAVELGKAWLAENVRWSWQDQLSLPVAARRLGITPGVFPVRQIERNGRGFLANRWLRIWAHVAPPAPKPAELPPLERGVSVLIPYTSDDEHRQAARSHVFDWYARHFPAWEIIEGHADGDWSKGAALADAARRASHDLLVIADADCIIEAPVLHEAAQTAAAGAAAWVVPHRRVHRLSEKHTERVYAGAEPEARDLARPAYTGVAGGGITILTRDAWDTVGGIDPRFIGWGGEDLAFGWALETLVGQCVRLKGRLFHLWHQQEPIGASRRGCPESEALAGRYKDARGNPEQMRQLIDSARELVAAGGRK